MINKRLLQPVLTMLALAGFLSACTPKLFRDLDMQVVSSVSLSRGTLMPVFDNITEPVYYTAQLDYQKTEETGVSMMGILAMTQEAKGSYRLVMMSSFGVTLFDFSISRDSFVVNSCMDQMNKKVVLGILEKDFRTILMLNVPEKMKGRLYRTNSKPDWLGYGINADDGECDYLIEPNGISFKRTIQNGGPIKRMTAVFDEDVVTIQHPKLGLKIIMTKMPAQ